MAWITAIMLGHERGEGGGGRSVFGKMRGSVGEKGGGAVRSKGGEGGKQREEALMTQEPESLHIKP